MLAPTDKVMSTATGFLYKRNDIIYMITNGHNVTRLNPETKTRITESIAFPIKIKTQVRRKHPEQPDYVGFTFEENHLYQDNEFKIPNWYMHPQHGYNVDVIAVPLLSLRDHTLESYSFYPINEFNFQSEFDVIIADELYILGYPMDIVGGQYFPIWKRASVASEPSIPIDNLPKFLVDTATRPGMSGSPVIMQRTTVHKKGTGIQLIGTIRNFAGVYSGRIGAKSDIEAQLGIVWKAHLIDEIIDGKMLGTTDFQEL